jgi:hypothetical protein
VKKGGDTKKQRGDDSRMPMFIAERRPLLHRETTFTEGKSFRNSIVKEGIEQF